MKIYCGIAACRSRKISKWLILLVAAMTIVLFIFIGIKRIIPIQNPSERKLCEMYHLYLKDYSSPDASYTDELTESSARPSGVTQLTESAMTYDVVQPLLENDRLPSEGTYLLILVTSAPDNFERREAIRNSWANSTRWKPQVPETGSKTVFLVGKSPTNYTDMLLKSESDRFGDVLIGEYLDTYRNLTLKVLHGFSWANHHCQSKFILKTDDDCFVNVPLLLQFLWKLNPVPVDLYAGSVYWSSRVVRDPKNRWYVSTSEHPRSRYVPYTFGPGYILGRGALDKLLQFSGKVHPFPVEDAYVGTVLNLAGVQPTTSDRFVIVPKPMDVCSFLYSFVVQYVNASMQYKKQEMVNKVKYLSSLEDAKDWV